MSSKQRMTTIRILHNSSKTFPTACFTLYFWSLVLGIKSSRGTPLNSDFLRCCLFPSAGGPSKSSCFCSSPTAAAFFLRCPPSPPTGLRRTCQTLQSSPPPPWRRRPRGSNPTLTRRDGQVPLLGTRRPECCRRPECYQHLLLVLLRTHLPPVPPPVPPRLPPPPP